MNVAGCSAAAKPAPWRNWWVVVEVAASEASEAGYLYKKLAVIPPVCLLCILPEKSPLFPFVFPWVGQAPRKSLRIFLTHSLPIPQSLIPLALAGEHSLSLPTTVLPT